MELIDFRCFWGVFGVLVSGFCGVFVVSGVLSCVIEGIGWFSVVFRAFTLYIGYLGIFGVLSGFGLTYRLGFRLVFWVAILLSGLCNFGSE